MISVRKRCVQSAKRWIGTPYLHQASVCGVGADCLGLIRGVWREVIGPEPEMPPVYSADWSELKTSEILLEALDRQLKPVNINFYRAGDVVAFRLTDKAISKHVGIISTVKAGQAQMIHSYNRRGVIESPLNFAWQRRCSAQYEFPNKDK
jgi:NlpC/P60 family putative phage cell wall peptidase